MAALTTSRPEKVPDGDAGGRATSPQPAALRDLVLVRLPAQGGAAPPEAPPDPGPLVAHPLPPGEWRQAAELALAALVADGLASEKRGRYEATEAGSATAARYLLLRATQRIGAWPDVRDTLLIARALGLDGETAPKLKALSTPEGLRALIVQKAFGMPRRLKTSPARLRTELAVIALERAFGNKLKSGLGANGGFSPKAGRMLAAQLSRRPREFSSDSKLIAALAAEHVDAVQPTLDVLRAAILRRFVSEIIGGEAPAAGVAPATTPRRVPNAAPAADTPKASGRQNAVPVPDNDTTPAAPPLPSYRPDLETFTVEVMRAAAGTAEGWPGNRKAFISHVWPAIRDSRPEWGLSEIEFKCMLVEAHRAGRLALTGADLRNKGNIKDIQDSAISYMNTVWHYVRIED